MLDQYEQPPFAKGLTLPPSVIAANAEEKAKEFDVRTTGVQLPAASLSGGNQQKVVLARELSQPVVSLLIASQPTRGVDVGSIEFVHKRDRRRARRGVAGPDRLHRARRGRRARRPDRGHVPRPDRRHRPAGHPARRPRPDDGRRPAGRSRAGRSVPRPIRRSRSEQHRADDRGHRAGPRAEAEPSGVGRPARALRAVVPAGAGRRRDPDRLRRPRRPRGGASTSSPPRWTPSAPRGPRCPRPTRRSSPAR